MKRSLNKNHSSTSQQQSILSQKYLEELTMDEAVVYAFFNGYGL
jgi:hypothetical protein